MTAPKDGGAFVACDHEWKKEKMHCTLPKGHWPADTHEARDINGRLRAMWASDINLTPAQYRKAKGLPARSR